MAKKLDEYPTYSQEEEYQLFGSANSPTEEQYQVSNELIHQRSERPR